MILLLGGISSFNSMRTIKKLILFLCISSLLVLMVIIGGYMYVEYTSNGLTYRNIDDIHYNKVGVVIRTNPTSRYYSGRRNPYYDYHIKAAVALYNAGKVERIFISDDNRHKSYSELDLMKTDWAKVGIPEQHIYLDFAGFRTFDAIVRAKKVSGLDDFTIISQKFHNKRAICLAKWQDIYAIGFNAIDVSVRAGLNSYAGVVYHE